MKDKYFDFIIHGGDYNPDQWIRTKEIWDEDIRLMKLAHVNSATVGIFSWSALEPEEGVYTFEWLDEIMDKLAANGIAAVLATPSGARPAWLAEKYPEVLRVEQNGIRNEFGVRHNHCLTSPVYREKVRKINTLLAERYAGHPALKMWHISNEYSGACYCDKCREGFRQWLAKRYNNDIDELNYRWWNGFWSHNLNGFSQINPPTDRGEGKHVPALKLDWSRFVTDCHISFFENEIAPLRKYTPDIPVTTNFMNMYGGINYQDFAKHVDIVSWDNYMDWELKDAADVGAETAFVHDVFRSMKDGKPFFMMESTPSVVNWHPVNKIPKPGSQELASVQAVAHGSDSVQYFQWRKSRGGHEKFHGAVVDHEGTENTRVFREIAHTGTGLEKLAGITGSRCESRAAVIYDWDNARAFEYFCGYNNEYRDLVREAKKWYRPFYELGISTDVISAEQDFSKYDVIAAPYMYTLRPGAGEKIKRYVENGGTFIATALFACADMTDLCFLGGFPGDGLQEVFGVWAEETDSLTEDKPGKALYNGKEFSVDRFADIIHARTAEVLGVYDSDFYAGSPCVTVNSYGKGKAYYAAFGNENGFTGTLVRDIVNGLGILPDAPIEKPDCVGLRKRGDFVFLLNFSDDTQTVKTEMVFTDVMNGGTVTGEITLKARGYAVLKE